MPNYKRVNRLTIDRIDNNQGYSINNICKACHICNTVKGAFINADTMQIVGRKILQSILNEVEALKILSKKCVPHYVRLQLDSGDLQGMDVRVHNHSSIPVIGNTVTEV